MRLNDEQQHALKTMAQFCAGDKPFFCLKGYAGTGKTTTIQNLVEEIAPMRVAFTAPTNKATRVLQKMANAHGLSSNVDVMTIHSLLGLVVTQQGDKEVLKQKNRIKAGGYDVIVVDECSMVDRELYDHISNAAKDCRVIFMGDPAQLPPVNESESLTFNTRLQAELTTVMRQRGDNPALGVCQDVRMAGKDRQEIWIQPRASNDGLKGVHVMQGSLWEDWMPSAFSHKQFDQDHDRFRIIAYRNKTVDYLNRKIQALRYPDLQTPFAIGEPVVFSKPVKNEALIDPIPASSDKLIVNTEEEGVVRRVKMETDPQSHGLECWRVAVDLLSGKTVDVRILDEANNRKHAQKLRELASEARNQDSATQWWEFWKLKDAFASIRCAYAMTAHKSQGSTFENVFVDVLDILHGNRNKPEAMQCLYVACSRASHNLILNSNHIDAA